jgi:hypothetical protein
MDVRASRWAKLACLVAVLWALYLMSWPGPWGVEEAKPTILAVVFAALGHRLKVATWYLVIAFSISFFLHIAVSGYLSCLGPDGECGSTPREAAVLTFFISVIFSQSIFGGLSCFPQPPTHFSVVAPANISLQADRER